MKWVKYNLHYMHSSKQGKNNIDNYCYVRCYVLSVNNVFEFAEK